MITWMQRHKKYLIITIWISTIAFVGAGFVGWGQYNYGDKAGSVAKVGEVEITMGELQKSYSSLYAQYNKMFQGNFDEEKAKSFGLQSQALQQLTNQALILNLAKSYDLEVSSKELINELRQQEYFFKDGVFDKEIYKQVLSSNNLSLKEYEAGLKKELLIRKTLKLLPVETTPNENSIISSILNIADKINYKVISDAKIDVDTSDSALKPYWEKNQQNFMSEVSYDIKYIKQDKISATYDEATISKYYGENKSHFKDSEGKILPLEEAKNDVIDELNTKATKDTALRTYIAYKKGKLDANVKVQELVISASNNPFSPESLESISKLSITSPFMKPVLVNGEYYTFELIKTNPSKVKTFQEAKEELLPQYIAQEKKSKLLKLAQDSVSSFSGETTEFLTAKDAIKLTNMDIQDANEFLKQLFVTQNKRGFINLENGKIVLYDILEQKMLDNSNINQDDSIIRLKSAIFNEGLLKTLQNKYATEIFIKGL